MKTFLAVIGALTLLGWAAALTVAAVNAYRAKRSDPPPVELAPRLALYMVRDKANGVPRQYRHVGAVDTDRVIADLYPCGAINATCRKHDPEHCAEVRCCPTCVTNPSRPPAA